MANKIKGEFELKAGDTVYLGRFGMNALVEIEEHFGKSVEEVFADMGNSKSMKAARAIIGAALHSYRPELTSRQIGEIIDAVGIDEVSRIMAEGVRAAFPEAAKAEGDATAHPTKSGAAAVGIGPG